MKLKLYTASGSFVADCEVGGTEYPRFVRWGDRVFMYYGKPLNATEPQYREMDIPQTRALITNV